MLGDSFEFGVGLNDDQTLAYYLKEFSGGKFEPINLAIPGQGPNQVLRQLEIGEPYRSGRREFAWAFLTTIDDHVQRANGKLYWLRDAPRYVIEADGRLVLKGTFLSPSQFEQKLVVGSRVFSMARNILQSDPEEEGRLFARILQEIDTVAARDYGAKLVVLYYAGETWHGELSGARKSMLPLLCRSGARLIDVNSLLPVTSDDAGQFYIKGDGHPTAALNRLLAKTLLADMPSLAIGNAACR